MPPLGWRVICAVDEVIEVWAVEGWRGDMRRDEALTPWDSADASALTAWVRVEESGVARRLVELLQLDAEAAAQLGQRILQGSEDEEGGLVQVQATRSVRALGEVLRSRRMFHELVRMAAACLVLRPRPTPGWPPAARQPKPPDAHHLSLLDLESRLF